MKGRRTQLGSSAPATRAPGIAAPRIVGVIGGSGAGKSWLADRLQEALGDRAVRLSLDCFYRDRSRLSPVRRARVNFDHPRAIDWQRFVQALVELRMGRTARVPVYDFGSHCRLEQLTFVEPRPVIIVDGLWLAHRPQLRRLFDSIIYLDCPTRVRLQRRIARDKKARGRTAESVREQFWGTVEPMHVLFVEPQRASADIILRRCTARDIRALVEELKL